MNKDPYRAGLRRLATSVIRRIILPVCAVTSLFLTFSSAAQSSDKHLVRVSDPKETARLVAAGQRLVADYGGYQLIELSGGVTSSPSVAEAVDHFNRIELNAISIDSSSTKVQQMRHPLAAFSGKRLHLVHFAGPVKPEWLQQLTQAGARIVSYVPNNAYLVYGDYASLSGVQTMAVSAPHIKWDGEFLPEYKIPSSGQVLSKTGATAAQTDLFAIQMIADDDANSSTLALIDQLKLEAPKRQHGLMHYKNMLVRLPPDKIAQVAAQPDVLSVHPYREPKLMDERQDMIIAGQIGSNGRPTGPGYLNFLAGKGIFEQDFVQSGLVIDISDSGVDNGTIEPAHFGLRRQQGSNSFSRVQYVRLFGTPNPKSTLLGCDGHGTLNAHIMIGNVPQSNSFNIFPYADTAGFHYGIGVCPFAKVGSSVIFDPKFTTPDYQDLQSRAYEDGARVSGNSWGADSFGAYSIDSQEYDSLVRDAQQNSSVLPGPGNQEMVIVFAAGNSGPGPQTIGDPGTAKNVITVGAAENVQIFGAPDRSGIDDRGANNANDIISFSSRGPTADGRKKPDIVAPGTHVSGGVAQADAPGSNGTAIACFDGTGVSGGANPPGVTTNIYFPQGQQWYTASSGTSHSTPAVAGGAALLIQYLRASGIPAPSAALIKGYLMNSARYLNGANANDSLWSTAQGMGEMNLDNTFNGLPRIIRDQDPAEVLGTSGQIRAITGQIADSSQPLRVTLAWSDAPGSTFSQAYNNDLDLIVTINGQTYKGNVFTGPVSTTGGTADHKNNVESVFLPAGLSGSFVIQVVAANINSDAINLEPTVPHFPEQDFALVAQNAIETPAPVIRISDTALISEVGGVPNGFVDPGETVTMRVSMENVGTQPTANLVATLLAINGVTNPSGPQTYGAMAPGDLPVTHPYTFTAGAACGSDIIAVFDLSDRGTSLGTVSFTVHIGLSFTNKTQIGTSSFIAINDYAAASPYPSTINVSGLSNTIEKVTLTLTNLSHTFLSDVQMVLVSPSGIAVDLMSNVGAGSSVNGVNITFDDDALTGLPGAGFIGSGVYLPSGSPFDFLPAPAPLAPYATALSALIGSNPNGQWSLYVADNAPLDFGSIGGWGLTFSSSLNVCNRLVSDLQISQTATPDRVVGGDFLTYSITVDNLGPNLATNIVVVQTLPNSVSITKVASPQGSFSISNNVVTFNVGSLGVGASYTATVTVTPLFAHSIHATATVSCGTVDPNPGNNFAETLTPYGKTFTNPAQIVIRDNTTALPYPATINVTGLTGYVNHVSVTISNLAHGYSRDIDMILVGPTGKKTYLMSDVGPGAGVTNLTFTFDDSAANFLNQSSNGSGIYKPTNFDTDTDLFPGPAPAGPYSTNMSIFTGVNPSGNWSLYVRDDSNGSSGSILNGWALTFVMGDNITNDIAVGVSASSDPVPRGTTLTYTVGITNNGPSAANLVSVTNILPLSVSLRSATVSQGSYTVSGNTVIGNLGTLNPHATATLTLVGTPTVIGLITNTASAGADDIDSNPANNSASSVVTVALPPGSTASVAPISIPTVGPASLYPSTITVSGLTGVVGKITVNLDRLTHTFPQDLDVLLVGPNGAKTVLMSHAGGSSSINGVSLTFDDAASSSLNLGAITSGRYKPTALQAVADLPSPAPAGPYSTNLWVFSGINPNGDWSLYVNDTSPPDGGSLNGWSFSIVFEPVLSVTRSGSNLLIAWPTNSVGFNLEGSSNLTSKAWFPIVTPPVTIGNQYIVTESLSNGLRFYRLKE